MISQSTASTATEDSCHVSVLESARISLQNDERARAGVIMRAGLVVIQTGSRQT
jgi:hypothetical protein